MASKKPAAPANQQKSQGQLQSHVVSAQWFGPLPPPGALREFDALIDNGAERSMRMIEKEQDTRIENDRRVLRADILDGLLGKIMGFVLVCVGFTIRSVIARAHPVVSVAFIGIPAAALIGKFLVRRK